MKKMFSIVLALSIILGNLVLFSSNVYASGTATLEFLTDAIYDKIGSSSEGLIWTKTGDFDYRYIDETGKVVIDAIRSAELLGDPNMSSGISEVGDFHDGLAYVRMNNGVQLFIDKQGKLAFSIQEKSGFYEMKTSSSFNEGISFGRVPGINIIFDKAGNVTIEANDKDAYGDRFSEGLLNFGVGKVEVKKDGYMDKNRTVVIEPQFEDSRPFNQGIAPVKLGGKWGFIDKTGKFIIQPKYDSFWANDANYSCAIFNEGLGFVKKNEKWCIIDKNGNEIGDFVWDNGGAFVNGYACVKQGEKYTYVDNKGKVAINAQFDDANHFSNGVALVKKDGAYKLIDTAGNVVSSQTWDFEGSKITFSSPNIIFYKQNGKWGLAKIKSSQTAITQTPKSQDSISIIIDGQKIKFEIEPQIINGRTMLPLRAICESLGMTVAWDATTSTATLTKGKDVIVHKVGEPKIIINGVAKDFDTASTIINGRTLVPARMMAEAINASVDWDGATSTVTIKTK